MMIDVLDPATGFDFYNVTTDHMLHKQNVQYRVYQNITDEIKTTMMTSMTWNTSPV